MRCICYSSTYINISLCIYKINGLKMVPNIQKWTDESLRRYQWTNEYMHGYREHVDKHRGGGPVLSWKSSGLQPIWHYTSKSGMQNSSPNWCYIRSFAKILQTHIVMHTYRMQYTPAKCLLFILRSRYKKFSK